ncbi:uncharacterized protein [Acropora muricata]|uniref:UPF0746 protein DDB_G0281095-like n=1 Tax=Acropora millepora TaxID=45264 RepID=UPI001CF48D2E|nr:UPF0746 protein DDB_G0281095-like [Acropora millepora]
MLFFLRKKQKVFRWKRHHNILFLKEVLSLEPYRFKNGSKERGEIWNQFASNLNGKPDSGLNTTQRGVRTQYDKLIEDFVQKEREEKKATGIDADYDELDQLLNDTYERASDAAADLARQAKEKEKAACDEKQQAEDIRTQAMERQEKKQPNKRKSTVLKELLEEGRKSKNEMEMKRIALEEQRLQADKEGHTFFENVVTKQQQQQMMKLHLENQQQQQVSQQQQQKVMAELQLQNSHIQLELLKALKDLKDK